jgi:hypothetical protein
MELWLGEAVEVAIDYLWLQESRETPIIFVYKDWKKRESWVSEAKQQK